MSEYLFDIGMLTRMPSHVAVAWRCFRWRRTAMTSREQLSYACAESNSYAIKTHFLDNKLLQMAQNPYSYTIWFDFCFTAHQHSLLGSFQCRGVLLLWHMVAQGPVVLAARAGRVGCILGGCFISSILSSFSNASSVGRRLNILKYCGLGRYNPAVVVSYYRRHAR